MCFWISPVIHLWRCELTSYNSQIAYGTDSSIVQRFVVLAYGARGEREVSSWK